MTPDTPKVLPFRYEAPEGICPKCCKSILACPCRVEVRGKRLVSIDEGKVPERESGGDEAA